ncbi:MAG: VOC family protein [Planctomycetota bacterium]|jgi:catechol 2,3-dioxygenase-like lactoylglutathione lyase family enzyme
MELGVFSLSLAVEDIDKSLAFYRAFGFEVIGGKRDENWIILRRAEVKIGLFQGTFDRNILTFNPPDVRAVQRELRENGLEFTLEADESSEGPAHAMLVDPDGNRILLDQHA